MQLDVQLTADPIPDLLPAPAAGVAGAWVEFRGLVRADESGQTIAALEYEAYSPMAEREMVRILGDIAERHPCLVARVIHRVGVVPVGDAAIYIGIAGRHRRESFAMLAEFMDRLKQDVPIWKQRALAEWPVRNSAAGAPVQPCACAVPPDLKTRPASADEVMALVREFCRPLETETVALDDAVGRVLRDPVTAPEDQPPFDRSSVDGYAIRMDDPGMRFQVVGEIRAGDWAPCALLPGQALRIATGGAVPAEGLQVIMREDVGAAHGRITILRRDADRNIRFRGQDASAGAVLAGSGAVLHPGAIGLLASVGAVRPRVTRLPGVLHLATGNEIVDPAHAPAPGRIRDSNSALVRAFLSRWGISPVQRRVGEDASALAAALPAAGVGMPHLVLISGGASVGEHDFTRTVLEQAGFEIRVARTTARPGKPLLVAARGETLAFGLPGNPLAHFVCLNLYVRMALESWSARQQLPAFVHGLLAADLPGDGNARETFWPARWEVGAGAPMLTPLRWASSGDLTALASANAILRVAPGTRTLDRGSRIPFLPTERFS